MPSLVASIAMFLVVLALMLGIIATTIGSLAFTKTTNLSNNGPKNEQVTSAQLFGFEKLSGSVSSNDTILTAFGKLSNSITASGTVTTVVAANGWAAAVGPALTLSITPSGILKGSGGTIQAALSTDITSAILTGYISGAGVISSTDTLLQAIQKLNGNIATVATTTVVAANGFGLSTGPALTLTVTPTGVLKGSGTAIQSAIATDITGQLLTSYAPIPGTVTATDSILTGLGKVDGNSKLPSFIPFGSGGSPYITLQSKSSAPGDTPDSAALAWGINFDTFSSVFLSPTPPSPLVVIAPFTVPSGTVLKELQGIFVCTTGIDQPDAASMRFRVWEEAGSLSFTWNEVVALTVDVDVTGFIDGQQGQGLNQGTYVTTPGRRLLLTATFINNLPTANNILISGFFQGHLGYATH